MELFNRVLGKISVIWQRAKDKREFLTSLVMAAEEGKLVDEGIKEVEAKYKELALTQNDLRWVRIRVYKAAFCSAKTDGMITAKEEVELENLQRFLMIPESKIAKSKRELARLRLITEIQTGNPPVIAVPNVVLQKAELAYWSEPASILEDRVVARRYEGGSHGFSFRITKGITYHVSSQRGHLVKDTAVIAVSSGELIVTNRRVIFRGNAKSFNIRLDKLLEFHFYSNGIRLTDDKGKPRIVIFDSDRNTEVVDAVLSYAVSCLAH